VTEIADGTTEGFKEPDEEFTPTFGSGDGTVRLETTGTIARSPTCDGKSSQTAMLGGGRQKPTDWFRVDTDLPQLEGA